MSEIERMQRYIERTGANFPAGSRYNMTMRDMLVLDEVEDRTFALIKAFEFGRSKGYRAAKAERRAAV